MSGHREWRAPLTGAVLWTCGPLSSGTGSVRVLPDGCLDLIRSSSGLLVAGPDTVAHLVAPPSGPLVGAPSHLVGLRLPPGIGPAVLGIPAHHLRDRRVPLADLWGDGPARRLEARLAQASPEEAGTQLDMLAAVRLRACVDGHRAGLIRPDPLLGGLVRILQQGFGVGEAAEAIGIGERQLHRRSLVAFGYGAKTLGRILRLIRALDRARSGMPLAQVAAVSGYADQPHLARDVRALAGVPLRALLAETA